MRSLQFLTTTLVSSMHVAVIVAEIVNVHVLLLPPMLKPVQNEISLSSGEVRTDVQCSAATVQASSAHVSMHVPELVKIDSTMSNSVRTVMPESVLKDALVVMVRFGMRM